MKMRSLDPQGKELPFSLDPVLLLLKDLKPLSAASCGFSLAAFEAQHRLSSSRHLATTVPVGGHGKFRPFRSHRWSARFCRLDKNATANDLNERNA